MNNIHESLQSFAVPIDDLSPLVNNPRRGNVDAIMASYKEFGQVRPIVVQRQEDGSMTVIAGNHQLEAARRLGWDKIAVVEFGEDDAQAVAFALADNRTSELGHTDPEMLNEMIVDVNDIYGDLFTGLGWDEFELAALDEQATRLGSIDEAGYVPPVIVDPTASHAGVAAPTTQNEEDPQPYSVQQTEDGNRIVPTGDVDSKSVAATGSTSIGASGSTKAVVQYTLVFDDADQQRHWYNFIRWLRSDAGYDGDTMAQMLMNFIDSHADF